MKPLFLFFVCFLMVSCGPAKIDVSGAVTHKFEIDMSNLEKYFVASCEEEQAPDIEQCVNEKIGKFLGYVLN